MIRRGFKLVYEQNLILEDSRIGPRVIQSLQNQQQASDAATTVS